MKHTKYWPNRDTDVEHLRAHVEFEGLRLVVMQLAQHARDLQINGKTVYDMPEDRVAFLGNSASDIEGIRNRTSVKHSTHYVKKPRGSAATMPAEASAASPAVAAVRKPRVSAATTPAE